MGLENPVHLVFIGIVALLVLGPRRLPEVARALGRGVREFREAIGGESGEHAHPQAPQAPQPPWPAPGAAPQEPAPAAVDPAQPIRSADAPDRGPL
jgi:sec-independent protein translocase protein TatA